MNEKLVENKDQQPEIKRYVLPDRNIIALDENSEIRQKNEKYRRGMQAAGIELPVEIQGSGISNPETREFTVRYPKGDVFASWAVTMHELGHLRQAERFGYKKLEDLPDEIDAEMDAWETGWERTKNFTPEILENLEKKFKTAKTSGLLSSFQDFAHFFKYFKKIILSLYYAHEKHAEDIDQFSEEAGRLLAEDIKKDPELLEFCTNQKRWLAGEIINQKEVENYIKIVAEKVARETV